ncbi:MAG: nucleoside phosphorylase [Saprospiraceae bacterium]|nr:nucleoside phosphorylase [Saprospiraceae bacterium]
MALQFPESELILHKDGSVYHLGLRPEELANTIITVGDPARVNSVSKHFDEISVIKQHREFITHTGRIGNLPISVVSTGIGTDNIDIVLNELDALLNIDFETRMTKSKLTSARIIRIGTTGSLREDLPVDSIVKSAFAIGLDNLLHFYQRESTAKIDMLLKEFKAAVPKLPVMPYYSEADPELLENIGPEWRKGITLTCPGFYAPQGRILRYEATVDDILGQAGKWNYHDLEATNFEMETAGIYGLASLLGHKALSVSAVVANRIKQEFSKNAAKVVNDLISNVLDQISRIST